MKKRPQRESTAQFDDLVELMALLRSPEGCPWDRAQDHRTLRRCLLEEAYEVLEAIDHDDPQALCQELGDLLLQVIFHAQLAAEAGRFDIAAVVAGLHDKLVVRHGHVFGDKQADTPEAVVAEWESLKQEQRGQTAAQQMAAVPRAMPALARAQIVLRQAARSRSARTAEQARAALTEASAGLAAGGRGAEAKLGDLLLAAVDLARSAGLDAEQALRERVDRLVAESGAQHTA